MNAPEHTPRGLLDRISRLNAQLACQEGEAAFAAGLRPDSCPYTPDTDAGEFLHHFYVAGWWLAARPGVEGARTMHFARTFRGSYRPPRPGR